MKGIAAAAALLLIATPVAAQTIRPADAGAHTGQTVTVEGVVSEVHTAASSGTTFIDLGGRYPNNAFTAVIFPDSARAFPNVGMLNSKTVDVTGPIRLYEGKPEIILKAAGQLKSR
ncbi:MAG: nucleotide-binding protein [Alphaproteobacteria bacterium]|nr:nucleotide-binding protein [Alphaproteobacteria bacterium]MDE2112188.1 nucleotide-binding protein [Alphaproteobacteria bacterium]MDE2495819.1 nucleotide-binding protein [Alphaproteobacteria bacterium]